MIARLKGIIIEKTADSVIVDVNGVGYHVFVSQRGLKELQNGETTFFIYTHVREDQITLFGFLSQEEKSIFERLLSVSGIGPKLALSILSGMPPNAIVQAVIKEDLARLHAIPGIGKKTAERIVVDLKDKFLKDFAEVGIAQKIDKSLYNDSMSALINLGYPRVMAEKALAKISFDGVTTVQSVIKEALKSL